MERAATSSSCGAIPNRGLVNGPWPTAMCFRPTMAVRHVFTTTSSSVRLHHAGSLVVEPSARALDCISEQCCDGKAAYRLWGIRRLETSQARHRQRGLRIGPSRRHSPSDAPRFRAEKKTCDRREAWPPTSENASSSSHLRASVPLCRRLEPSETRVGGSTTNSPGVVASCAATGPAKAITNRRTSRAR